MFIHDTGDLLILCPNRCGHTNMYAYFGIPEYSLPKTELISDWTENPSTSEKIVVIRNPYDRVRSAYQLLHWTIENTGLPQSVTSEEWFYFHSIPYLYMIRSYEFRYIDFYKLDQYINWGSQQTIKFNATSSSQNYIRNKYYSYADLRREYIAYKEILQNKNEISIEEWKELTQ